ncbi:octanoyltransferase [Candidatus Woesearchaeota archaeon]|nr:octanoyltransferase [Candidatus Woesearchaeota archaeon]
MKFRLIDTGFNDAFQNMAVDEALLSSELPVLRFYRWKPAALSIGYFQHIGQINKQFCRNNSIDIVRRITGGNAVLHNNELTYSFIIDEKEMPKGVTESYKKIAQGLLNGLRNLGLDAAMNKDIAHGEKSMLCFSEPSWYEIVVNKKKIIGSAQKRIKGKLLQHGAILVDIDIKKYANCFNNCSGEIIKKLHGRMACIRQELEKFGLASLSRDCRPQGAGQGLRSNPSKPMHAKFFYESLKKFLVGGFEKTGIEFERSELSETEQELAQRLNNEKYSSGKWNFMR